MESPEEKFERVRDAVQQSILRHYPNPTRKDCPGNSVVREVASRTELQEDEPWQHITHCSPCYAEFLRYKEHFRQAAKLRSTRRRFLTATAASVVVAAGGFTWFFRESSARRDSELDLERQMLFRGSDSEEQPAQQPLVLSTGKLHLTIKLPLASEPGRYDVTLSKPRAAEPVFSFSGDAILTNGSTKMTADVALHVEPGPYVLTVRRRGSAWRYYPVEVRQPQ
jgi:hypothetical protein